MSQGATTEFRGYSTNGGRMRCVRFGAAVVAVALSLCGSLGSARAELLSLNFTGRVTDEILANGVVVPVFEPNIPSDWTGETISGSIVIDIGRVPPHVTKPGQATQIGARPELQPVDWAHAIVHQPDGSTLVIPSGPPPVPFPTAEGDDLYTRIENSVSQDVFYVQRSFTNGGQTFPQQHVSIDLSDTGPSGTEPGLVDSNDYREVQIDPASANWRNYGHVRALSAPGAGYAYAFTVLTVESEILPIPEPTSALMIGVGVAIVVAASRRRRLRS